MATSVVASCRVAGARLEPDATDTAPAPAAAHASVPSHHAPPAERCDVGTVPLSAGRGAMLAAGSAGAVLENESRGGSDDGKERPERERGGGLSPSAQTRAWSEARSASGVAEASRAIWPRRGLPRRVSGRGLARGLSRHKSKRAYPTPPNVVSPISERSPLSSCESALRATNANASTHGGEDAYG